MEMIKKEQIKDDGRYIIFYEFSDGEDKGKCKNKEINQREERKGNV